MDVVEPPMRRSRWLLRFSLRTLLLSVLAVGSAGGLWWNGKAWMQRFALPSYGFNADFSSDGTLLVVQRPKSNAEIWDTQTGTQISTLHGYTNFAMRACFSQDRSCVVTEDSKGMKKIWDVQSGAMLEDLSKLDGYLIDYLFDYDGFSLFTEGGNKDEPHFVKMWSARTKEILFEFKHPQNIHDVVVSSDKNRMATACADGILRVWNLKTGILELKCQGHSNAVIRARFLPGDARIVTTSWDLTARVWDAQTGKSLLVLSGHTGYVAGANFSADGNRIATAGLEGTVRVWDALSGRQEFVLSHSQQAHSAKFSKDGERILTSGYESAIHIWNRNGVHLAALKAGEGSPRAFFSEDGKRIFHVGEWPIVWERRRPEHWWGMAWLPEFWLAIVFGSAFGWSLRRDWRTPTEDNNGR